MGENKTAQTLLQKKKKKKKACFVIGLAKEQCDSSVDHVLGYIAYMYAEEYFQTKINESRSAARLIC